MHNEAIFTLKLILHTMTVHCERHSLQIMIIWKPLIFAIQGNDELQHVNMNALVGIIRQLASLSAHAETLFADLFNEVQNEEQKL